MEQLTVVAKIIAKRGKEKETQAALEALVPPTLQEERCITYDLHVSTDQPGIFLFYENWISYELWQKHLSSTHINSFRQVADNLLGKPTEISTWKIALPKK